MWPTIFWSGRNGEKKTFQLQNARLKDQRTENTTTLRISILLYRKLSYFFKETAFWNDWERITNPSRSLQRHLRMQYMLIREVADHRITVIRFWCNKSNQAPFSHQTSWRKNKKQKKKLKKTKETWFKGKEKKFSRLLYSSAWLYNKSDQKPAWRPGGWIPQRGYRRLASVIPKSPCHAQEKHPPSTTEDVTQVATLYGTGECVGERKNTGKATCALGAKTKRGILGAYVALLMSPCRVWYRWILFIKVKWSDRIQIQHKKNVISCNTEVKRFNCSKD